MTLNEYQAKAMETCLPSCRNVSYMLLNLLSEAGELADKVAKSIRSGAATLEGNDLMVAVEAHPTLRDDLMAEAGDVLWQLSGLCTVMGWELDAVGERNLEKLASRKRRGVIDGKGDDR